MTHLALIAGLAITGTQSTEPREMRLIRFPTIHGDTVVFTYASDLWVTDRKGGYARRLTTHPGLESNAKISPDGKWIAFTGNYDGGNDVYVIPVDGGEPRRLTFEPETSTVFGWTPDGKIGYTSAYGSTFTPRLWIVDPKGGMPIRTPLDEVRDGSFSSDGNWVAYNRVPSNRYNWRRYRGGTQGKISVYEFGTNRYSELPAKRENSWWPMVVADSIYYVSDRTQGTVNLYRYDIKSKKDVQLTNYADADIKWPFTDGKTIVFERDGYLWTYSIGTGKAEKVQLLLRSDHLSARPNLRRLGNSISDFSLSPSGVRVAVEARGELFSLPARNGETRNLTQSPGWRERFPRWSPDGKWIAYASDESGEWDLYIRPQMGGEAKRLTHRRPGPGLVEIDWAPDSKKIAFMTRSRELYWVDVDSGKLNLVYKSRYGLGGFDWSPDGKWLAYCEAGKNQFNAVHILNVETKKVTRVTDGRYSDNQVSFDLSGKYLYIVSSRTFRPSFGIYEYSLKVDNADRIYLLPLTKEQASPLIAPGDEEPAGEAGGAPRAGAPTAAGAGAPRKAPEVKIDFDGLADRAIPLPLPASSYGFIVGGNESVIYWTVGRARGAGTESGLGRFDLRTRDNQLLVPGFFGQVSFNASRTKMALQGPSGLSIQDVRPMAPSGPMAPGMMMGGGGGTVNTSGVEAVIDPRLEWRQIYWEAWRFMRDNFYDPNMLGIDWNGVGKHYEKYLEDVGHRADLNYVLGLMVGELGTGHAYVQGGDFGISVPGVPTGQLGVDYEADGKWVRFKWIYRGQNFDEGRRGPLGEPGINVGEGEYLLEIDGHKVSSEINPNSLLLNKANRTVTLTVNSKPTMDGARKVKVRTLASERGLRYTEWVEHNRRTVERLTNGRVGYMHVPNTSTDGAVAFIEGFYSQTDKEALIVDERYNGGGFIQPWFVDTLARQFKAKIQVRHSDDDGDAPVIEGPKVMLINHYAGSGGDFFPWLFKQANLGPLIGNRTWGGLVGISGGAPLVDGGSITAPEFGIYDHQKGRWIAENEGVAPDIEIDARPDLVAQGRDPQLEKAVEHLLEELRKKGKDYKRPEFPKVKMGGG